MKNPKSITILVVLSASIFGGCVSKKTSLGNTTPPSLDFNTQNLTLPKQPKFPLKALPAQEGVVVERKTTRVFLVEVGPERTRRMVFFSQPTEVGKSVNVLSYVIDDDPASTFYEGQ